MGLKEIRERQKNYYAKQVEVEKEQEQVQIKNQTILEYIDVLRNQLHGANDLVKKETKIEAIEKCKPFAEAVLAKTNLSTEYIIVFAWYTVWHKDIEQLEDFAKFCQFGIENELKLPNELSNDGKKGYLEILLYGLIDSQDKHFFTNDVFFEVVKQNLFDLEKNELDKAKIKTLKGKLPKDLLTLYCNKLYAKEPSKETLKILEWAYKTYGVKVSTIMGTLKKLLFKQG